MFNPHLSQREKEIDRQEALAYAEQDRLARLAKGYRAPRRWHLSLPAAAALGRIGALLKRPRHAGRLERSAQRQDPSLAAFGVDIDPPGSELSPSPAEEGVGVRGRPAAKAPLR